MKMRMKLIFTTALFLALLLTACDLHVISGSGNVVSESRPVSDFTAVNFTGTINYYGSPRPMHPPLALAR